MLQTFSIAINKTTFKDFVNCSAFLSFLRDLPSLDFACCEHSSRRRRRRRRRRRGRGDGVEGGDVFLDSQDPCESLLPAIEELYLVRDTFFPLDPTIRKARVDNLVREALVVLAEIAAGGLSHFLSLKREQFAVVVF
jgi:hypothetical protein